MKVLILLRTRAHPFVGFVERRVNPGQELDPGWFCLDVISEPLDLSNMMKLILNLQIEPSKIICYDIPLRESSKSCTVVVSKPLDP